METTKKVGLAVETDLIQTEQILKHVVLIVETIVPFHLDQMVVSRFCVLIVSKETQAVQNALNHDHQNHLDFLDRQMMRI